MTKQTDTTTTKTEKIFNIDMDTRNPGLTDIMYAVQNYPRAMADQRLYRYGRATFWGYFENHDKTSKKVMEQVDTLIGGIDWETGHQLILRGSVTDNHNKIVGTFKGGINLDTGIGLFSVTYTNI